MDFSGSLALFLLLASLFAVSGMLITLSPIFSLVTSEPQTPRVLAALSQSTHSVERLVFSTRSSLFLGWRLRRLERHRINIFRESFMGTRNYRLGSNFLFQDCLGAWRRMVIKNSVPGQWMFNGAQQQRFWNVLVGGVPENRCERRTRSSRERRITDKPNESYRTPL